MTGNVQLTRGAFIMKSFLRKAHFNSEMSAWSFSLSSLLVSPFLYVVILWNLKVRKSRMQLMVCPQFSNKKRTKNDYSQHLLFSFRIFLLTRWYDKEATSIQLTCYKMQLHTWWTLSYERAICTMGSKFSWICNLILVPLQIHIKHSWYKQS